MISFLDSNSCFFELNLTELSDLVPQHVSDVKFLMKVLNERDRRLVAGFLAKCCGHGGDKKIAEITGLDDKTVRRGRKELTQKAVSKRIRQLGGGRTPIYLDPTFQAELQALVEDEITGDPMTGHKWVRKTLRWIRKQLWVKQIKVSRSTIWSALNAMGYSLRKNVKQLARKQHPQRDQQFQYLNKLKKMFLKVGNPVISIDTKKKEQIGNFAAKGSKLGKVPIKTLDHDFPSDAEGKLIPFGIYELLRNRGYVYCGTSYETSAFAVDALVYWWKTVGRAAYPSATKLLILCDAGGANGYRRRQWKWELQEQLADRLGLTITVCHYPSGCSKWNPIEHRLFSFISLNWAGQPLTSYELALGYIRSTTTEQGLIVDAVLLTKEYQKGIKISEIQMSTIRLRHHKTCPQWNYTIHPRPRTTPS